MIYPARPCDCGCSARFEPRRKDKRFFLPAHRAAAWRRMNVSRATSACLHAEVGSAAQRTPFTSH